MWMERETDRQMYDEGSNCFSKTWRMRVNTAKALAQNTQ